MKHDKAVLMFLQRWVVSTCPSLEGITQRVLAFILGVTEETISAFISSHLTVKLLIQEVNLIISLTLSAFFFFFCKC